MVNIFICDVNILSKLAIVGERGIAIIREANIVPYDMAFFDIEPDRLQFLFVKILIEVEPNLGEELTTSSYILKTVSDRLISIKMTNVVRQTLANEMSVDGLNSPLKKASLTGFHATAKQYRGEGGFAILRDDEDNLNDQDGSSGRNKHEQGANSARHGLLRGAGADELAHQQR